MKPDGKKVVKMGKTDFAWYFIDASDIKTEEGCIELAYKIAGIGKLKYAECRGEHDMDTRDKIAVFHSQEEFAKGMDRVREIDVERITVKTLVDGEYVTAEIAPVWNNDEGTQITVSGNNEEIILKVARAIVKLGNG